MLEGKAPGGGDGLGMLLGAALPEQILTALLEEGEVAGQAVAGGGEVGAGLVEGQGEAAEFARELAGWRAGAAGAHPAPA